MGLSSRLVNYELIQTLFLVAGLPSNESTMGRNPGARPNFACGALAPPTRPLVPSRPDQLRALPCSISPTTPTRNRQHVRLQAQPQPVREALRRSRAPEPHHGFPVGAGQALHGVLLLVARGHVLPPVQAARDQGSYRYCGQDGQAHGSHLRR
jgi:hypothetical protein